VTTGPAVPTQAAVNAALLTVADFPTGFTTTPPTQSNAPPVCGLQDIRSQAIARGEVVFEQQSGSVATTYVDDIIDALPPGVAKNDLDQEQRTLSSCTSYTTTSNGQPITVHVAPLSFPSVGDQTVALRLTLQAQSGGPQSADEIIIRAGNNEALVNNNGANGVDTSLTESLARKQAVKLASLPSSTTTRAPTTTTTAPATTTTPPTKVGDTVHFADGSTLQVISFGPVVHSIGGLAQSDMKAAQVLGCAGSVPATFNPFFFSLAMADHSRVSWSIGPEDQLDPSQVKPGDCTRGEVGFKVPGGETPTAVIVDNHSTQQAQWMIAGSGT
jgi:hypothetical protein